MAIRDVVHHFAVYRPRHGAALRVAASVGLGLMTIALLPDTLTAAARTAAGWDVSALSQVLIVFWLVRKLDAHGLSEHAFQVAPSHYVFRPLIVVGAGTSLITTVWVLRIAPSQGAFSETWHLLLGAGTVLLTWFTIQTLFALRYAHLYYGGDRTGDGDHGLKFPGDNEPDYMDFLYFSLCAGMTFQVSDVSITSRRFREAMIFHGVLSFLYSSFIVALLVDVAANLV